MMRNVAVVVVVVVVVVFVVFEQRFSFKKRTFDNNRTKKKS